LLPALEGDKTTIKAQVEEGGIRMRAGRGSWMDGHMGGQGRRGGGFPEGAADLGAAGRKKLTSFYLSVQSKSIG